MKRECKIDLVKSQFVRVKTPSSYKRNHVIRVAVPKNNLQDHDCKHISILQIDYGAYISTRVEDEDINQ